MLILSVLAILSYGIQLIPTPFKATQTAVNTVCLNLAYSYLAGSIFYFLTVVLPRMRDKAVVGKAVELKLNVIAKIIDSILLEFSSDLNLNRIDISDIESCREMLMSKSWSSIVQSQKELFKVDMTYLKFMWLHQQGIVNQINEIIIGYKEYLSADHLAELEELKNENIFKSINTFVAIPYIAIEEDGAKHFADEFCKMLKRFNEIRITFKKSL